MEYQELKKIIKDMENFKLDSVKIEFPDGTKISMKKTKIIMWFMLQEKLLHKLA